MQEVLAGPASYSFSFEGTSYLVKRGQSIENLPEGAKEYLRNQVNSGNRATNGLLNPPSSIIQRVTDNHVKGLAETLIPHDAAPERPKEVTKAKTEKVTIDTKALKAAVKG